MNIVPVKLRILPVMVTMLVSTGTGAFARADSNERAVFDALLAGNDSIVLAGQTVRFHNPGPPPESGGMRTPRFTAALRRFPQSLMARLDSISRVPRLAASLDIPRQVTIMSDSMQRDIFASGVEGGWQEFRRRFPRRHGYYRVSPIAFNSDSTEAMVYRAVHCGGLCADGTVFWLRRDREGRWAAVDSLLLWAS